MISANGRETALNQIRILQSAMRPAGGYLEFRAFNDAGGARSFFVPVEAGEDVLFARIDALQALSDKGWGIYVGMNPRARESGSKRDVERYTTLFLDLDLEKAGIDREYALAEIQKISPIPPDTVVDSGGGFHVSYLIQPTNDYGAWYSMQLALFEMFEHLGADRSVVSDSARILRLTPFPNWKYDREGGGRPTEIIQFTARDASPSIEEMSDIFNIRNAEAKVSREAARHTLPKSLDNGSRNVSLFKEASRFRNFGYEYEEMLPSLLALNEMRGNPPLPESEVEALVRSASRYTPEWEIGEFDDDSDDITEIDPARLGKLLGELRQAEYPERDWLLYGLLRGWTGLLIATYDTGKTTLARNIMASAAIGRPYLNDLVPGRKPLRVLFLDFEDTSEMNAQDFEKMLNNFTDEERGMLDANLRIISPLDIDAPDLNLSDERHLKLIEDVALHHEADLIVIDTMQKAFTLSNENDNSEVGNKVIKPLQRVAKKANAGILLVHHIGKRSLDEGGASNSNFKARGANALMNDTKMVIELEKKKGGTTLNFAKIKAKKPKEVVIELDAETRWFELDDTGAPAGDELRHKIARLTCAEISHSELVAVTKAQYEVSESTAKRGIRNALEAGYIEKNDSGRYYRPGCIPFRPGEVVEISQSVS